MDQNESYDPSLTPSQQPVVEIGKGAYWKRRRARRLERFYSRVHGSEAVAPQQGKPASQATGERSSPAHAAPRPPRAKAATPAQRERDAALAGANDMIMMHQLWEILQRIDENLRRLRQLAESRQQAPAVFTPP